MDEQENKKERKGLLKAMEDHPKTTFFIRLFSWFLFAGVLPFLFLVWKFGLFQSDAKMNFGGWGIIGVVLILIVLLVAIHYVKIAIGAKNVFIMQCINGVCRVILPLAAALIIFWIIRDELTRFIQFLGCTIICELIAIPLNPLPEWAAQHQEDVEEEKRKDTVNYFIDTFFKRKKKEEE